MSISKLSAACVFLIMFLSSCQTTPHIYFASPYQYPESKQYIACAVERARERAFDNPHWARNDDLDVVINASIKDCHHLLVAFQRAAADDGMPEEKIAYFDYILSTRIWKEAWDEIGEAREARFRQMKL